MSKYLCRKNYYFYYFFFLFITSSRFCCCCCCCCCCSLSVIAANRKNYTNYFFFHFFPLFTITLDKDDHIKSENYLIEFNYSWMMLVMLFSFESLITVCLVVLRYNYHQTNKQKNITVSPYNNYLKERWLIAIKKTHQTRQVFDSHCPTWHDSVKLFFCHLI